MRISVLIPVYNAAESLKRCLDSIISQSYSDWEVIAVDDGSEDQSYQILQEYAARDKRIAAFTKANEGPGLTRNYALDRAKGSYIVFIDADDYVEPIYFEKLVNCISNENSDVVFIDVIQELPDGNVICKEKMSSFASCSKKDLICYQMCGTMPWGGVRKAARRSLIENHAIRYTKDPVGEEAVYSYKLLKYADVISFVPMLLYHYINYPASQSKGGGEDPWGPIAVALKEQVKKVGDYQEYADTLNCFTVTAAIVSLSRMAKCMSYAEFKRAAVEKMRETYERVDSSYHIDRKHMDLKVKLLLPVLKAKMYALVYWVAKLR